MKAYCAGNGQLHQMSMGDVTNTLDCMHDQQIVVCNRTPSLPVVVNSSGGGYPVRLTQVTTREQEQETERSANMSATGERKYVLRRLTPLECLRLQGLPDWWCDGANGSDSAIYKMCGNGLAIPCAYDVLHRIAKEVERADGHG